MRNLIYRICMVAVAVLGVSALGACSDDKPGNIEPRLRTLEAADISRTEATVAGQCVVDGGAVVPQLWFRYGEGEDMAHKSEAVGLDSGTDGLVRLHLTGLTPGTTYYYMLQGGNGTAVLSADRMAFTTLPNDMPSVGDAAVLSSSPMSIIVGYTITDDGGDPITASGCYLSRADGGDLGPGLGTELRVEQTSAPDADGMLRLRIGGLQPGIAYTVTPFAVNRNGEDRGAPATVTTSQATVMAEAGLFTELVGDDKYSYTSLSLAGPLNGSDLRTLRDMAGCDNEDNPSAGRLADIDLSGAQIVAGGMAYAAGRYTEDDVVGMGMFASCTALSSIVLPQQVVRIEGEAFKDCTSLRSLVVPASVADIKPSSGCTALAGITVSAANTHYSSEDGVLFSADGTAILWFPMGKSGEYTLPSTVTAVGDYAFRGCGIEQFAFADGLTSIGQCAFYGSKVREVSLPSKLRQVPTGTFQKCASLTTVRLGEKTELLGNYVFDGCPLTDIYISAPTPPVCSANTFTTSGTSIFSTCRLHVAKGRKLYYKYNSTWGQFARIVEE